MKGTVIGDINKMRTIMFLTPGICKSNCHLIITIVNSNKCSNIFILLNTLFKPYFLFEHRYLFKLFDCRLYFCIIKKSLKIPNRREGEKTHTGRKKKDKRTNNSLHNITHKTKDRVTPTPLKFGGELMCFGRVRSSYSASGNHHVTLVRNSLISNEWRKVSGTCLPQVKHTRGHPW
jgi:hypothetical protein